MRSARREFAKADLQKRYAVGLASAQIIAAFEVVVILISLRGRTVAAVDGLFSDRNRITLAVLVVLGAVAAIAGGMVNLAPSLRWFVAGRQPDPAQRRAAMRVPIRQSAILVATWVVSGAVVILLNFDAGVHGAALVSFAAVFGGIASACTGLLRTQRTLRPLTAAAQAGSGHVEMAHGLGTRLLVMWILCGALPCAGIVGLMVIRSNGWVLEKTASVDVPMLVFSLEALPVGLRVVALVARSISDPVREVVEAMSHVERGEIGAVVDVYERAEIGQLQGGFNSMVSGLKERDRLRDLFGRYVGADVVRRAVDEQESTSGDVREAAILFIDLAGSTELASQRPPEEVASVLNAFFRIVVAAVDEHRGLINKFQGDAALAVFGAPLRTYGSAAAAMATARILGVELRRLAAVDFGIGVSAGPVFAGNIGAESRYEYTVIGDAVNEAARLADCAKTTEMRILCSGAAVGRADATERTLWTSRGSTVLRGRRAATQMWTPAGEGST
jgi:adenylate cyclase